MMKRRYFGAMTAWSPAWAQSGDAKVDTFRRGIRAESQLARSQPEFKKTFDRSLGIFASDMRQVGA